MGTGDYRGSATDPLVDFSQVNAELALFDAQLTGKPQIVAINKIDLPDVKQRLPEIESEFAKKGLKPMVISGLARTGLRQLLYAAHRALQESEIEPIEAAVPQYKLEEELVEFEITREPDGAWRVTGKAIERAAEMTYWEYEEAVRRFQRLLDRMGIDRDMRKAGVQPGDTVRIGEHELEWQD